MRVLTLLISLLILASCAPKPDPAEAACLSGNQGACVIYQEHQANRRAAMGMFMQNNHPYQVPFYPMQTSQPVITNCSQFGNQFSCFSQ